MIISRDYQNNWTNDGRRQSFVLSLNHTIYICHLSLNCTGQASFAKFANNFLSKKAWLNLAEDKFSSCPKIYISIAANITETSDPAEGIYESFDENATTKPASRTTSKRVPLNDNDLDTGSETEAQDDSGGDMTAKMSSLMSALSMESLDSIDSSELTDDELDDDVTEKTQIKDRPEEADILPKPHDKTYATEEIKKFLKAEGIVSQKPDIGKIAKTFKFDLDKNAEYPAFDALRKFLDATNLRVDL